MWFLPWIVKHLLINVEQNFSPDHLCLKIKDLWDDWKSIIVELNLLIIPRNCCLGTGVETNHNYINC